MGMGQKFALRVGAAVAATAAAMVADAQPAAQKVTGPVAVYWVSAATQSGFGMPGMGAGPPGMGGGQPGMGGGRPSAAAMLQMMRGGGGPQHSLTLQLGSSQTSQGAPHAEHLPPQGLGAGFNLPLLTPQPVQAAPPPREAEDRPRVPQEFQRPKGKMLIFWGCGEHAKPGQPLVIDFAQMTPEKMAAGQMPPGLLAAFRGLDVRRMQPPSPGRNTTYGDWPNSQSRTTVPSEGSLVGQHTVTGSYSPEIQFALSKDQDFLGPLELTTNAKLPSGAVQLGWGALPGAEAYVASFIGGGGQDTVVMWTSSETQAAAFAMPDYIAPADIARLVEAKSLMGRDVTSCAVPKEAVDAGRQGLVQMTAYGHEANFVYPPRPKDPKIAWNRQWEVKVRYRSATGGMLGMAMPGAGGRGEYGDDGDGPPRRRGRGGPNGPGDASGPPPPPPQDAAAARRKAILQGLGGLIPH